MATVSRNKRKSAAGKANVKKRIASAKRRVTKSKGMGIKTAKQNIAARKKYLKNL